MIVKIRDVELIDMAEVQKRLGISERTLLDWTFKTPIKYYKIGNKFVFDGAYIDKLAEAVSKSTARNKIDIIRRLG